MNDRLFDMIRITVREQLDTLDNASWWSDPILEAMTQEERKRLGILVHEICLELRPLLTRMEQESISKDMAADKRSSN